MSADPPTLTGVSHEKEEMGAFSRFLQTRAYGIALK
jgi:hypothetical protein